jgi:phosphomannomutase|tara:strand:- start:913 stop:1617 length:705 start_codon:yes stop_codon:yes gene_type:complete
MRKYIFDVDGTLTPSRKQIEPKFLRFFREFIIYNHVTLITGSDREKTIEQVTPEIYNNCWRVYNCSGCDVYEGNRNVYRDSWELPKNVERFLEDELAYSCFPIRNGLHIERRPGGVNFSILGRGKDTSHGREEYVKWDKERLERVDIADRLKNQFPDLEVNLGGQTGLDLAAKGKNKGQIIKDFDKTDDLHFFGDMMSEGQNDWPLAMAIVDNMMGSCYNVNDYKETWELLLNI